MPVYPFRDRWPRIAEEAFLAFSAVVSGDVEIGPETNVWFGAIIRGDVAPTRIGARVSIQDNAVLHQSPNRPLIVEDDVVIGHGAIVHSAVVRRGALIGMGAVVLDGAVVEEGAIVGAGALVPPGGRVPAHTVVIGRPARPLRETTDADRAEHARIVREYVEKGRLYRAAGAGRPPLPETDRSPSKQTVPFKDAGDSYR
ncbi:MAG: gamma carbonic anhydrase family protein [Hydrogenibacillus schlegelii]|uniref:Gamma carbonic anhydrase family protein n=1 Tax=Hydrogenibacillus schlegelii TaxID=1484 RepID=A0A947CY31_HYDSH|nr:gamma carbonic anhydrase family protein [Hydrogenibacillus schlegelii]